MEKAFYTCRCLGQQFTFKEWGEYLEKNNSDGIVIKHGDFGFNIHDVCLTPNVVIDWHKNNCYFRVDTAQSMNGRWNYGYTYSTFYSGGGRGASFISNKNEGFATEKECVYAALIFMEERFKKDIDVGLLDDNGNPYTRHNSDVNVALKEIRKLKGRFNIVQLSLFD